MDEIASEIHALVRQFCEDDLSETEFTSKLIDLERRHPNPGNIGRAIQKGLRMVNADQSEEDQVWRLAQSVDDDMKSDYDEWSDASNWDIG